LVKPEAEGFKGIKEQANFFFFKIPMIPSGYSTRGKNQPECFKKQNACRIGHYIFQNVCALLRKNSVQ
jgi:hypothetical protein